MATILLAEDDMDIRSLTKAVLEQEGHTVHDACDGEEALSLLGLSGGPDPGKTPDILILDVLMPRAGGIEVYKKLMKHPNLRSIPVLFLTGKGSEELAGEEVPLTERTARLYKPFSMREIQSALKKLLEPRRS